MIIHDYYWTLFQKDIMIKSGDNEYPRICKMCVWVGGGHPDIPVIVVKFVCI